MSWVCWVVNHDGLFVLDRSGFYEQGGSLTAKAAHLTVLLRPQDSMRLTEVTSSGLRHENAGGCALLGLLGGYLWFVHISRFGGCELGWSFTPNVALLAVQLRRKLSTSSTKVTDSGLGHACR